MGASSARKGRVNECIAMVCCVCYNSGVFHFRSGTKCHHCAADNRFSADVETSNTRVRGKNKNKLLSSGHIKRNNLWKIALHRGGNVLAHCSLSSGEGRAIADKWMSKNKKEDLLYIRALTPACCISRSRQTG